MGLLTGLRCCAGDAKLSGQGGTFSTGQLFNLTNSKLTGGNLTGGKAANLSFRADLNLGHLPIGNKAT